MEKIIDLNRSQALVNLINANVCYCTWPRASGKTTGGIGPRIIRLSEIMPRSQFILYSDTYDRLEERIVPNVLDFINNETGLQEEVDYIKFKKPPHHWRKPLIPLSKFDHVISFKTGTALCLASQKVPGSANAYNAQAAIIDEAKYIKETKINTELLPALRGSQKYFGHLPEYRSHWYFTDKFGSEIKWILNKKHTVNKALIKAVLRLQVRIIELEQELKQFENPSLETIYKYKKQIIPLETKLNLIRRDLIYFSDAKPYENIAAVGEKYFRDLRRDIKSDYEYRVSILNEDPDRVENTFYPDLAERHFYEFTDDTDTNKPLIIAMDYQWRITPMAIAQYGKLRDNPYNSINFVNSLHVEHPYGIKECIEQFAALYQGHQKKLVYYVYDKNAIAKDPARESFNVIVIKHLKRLGWRVKEIYIGQPSDHDVNYENMKTYLQKRGEDSVLINRSRSKTMVSALYNAGAITSGGKTQKDKRAEKKENFYADQSTDFTDAFDQIPRAIIELKLIKPYDVGTTPMPTRFA